LTVGDNVLTHGFAVLPDPRVATTPAEFRAQFKLLDALHSKHGEINRAVNTIRTIRTQAAEWATRLKGTDSEKKVVAAGKALTEKLDAIEGELLQVKIQSDQDSLNYPVKLNSKLTALAFMVSYAEAGPTEQAKQLSKELIARVDEQLNNLKPIVETDLPAFNKLIAKSGIAAIVLADAT
jgi:hypothetical protein